MIFVNGELHIILKRTNLKIGRQFFILFLFVVSKKYTNAAQKPINYTNYIIKVLKHLKLISINTNFHDRTKNYLTRINVKIRFLLALIGDVKKH